MTRPHECDAIREMVFNYRRGELSELDAALFEETLLGCDSCARYTDRIMEMLDISEDAEAEDYLDAPVTDDFADSLFAAISAGIEAGDDVEAGDDEADESGESVAYRPPVRLEFATASNEDLDEEEDDLFEHVTPSRPWLKLAIAAAVLLGVGGAILATQLEPGGEQPRDQDGLAVNDEGNHSPARVEPATSDASLARAFEQLQPQRASDDTIKVFASAGAKWKLVGKAPEHLLELEQGTVLVEFLPRQKNERLKVVSGETEVAVLGTVFYVSAEEPGEARPARVGVITGKVRVEQPAADVADGDSARTLTLEDGQESVDAREITPIEATMKEQTEAFVDIKAHRAAIATRDEAPVVEKKSVAVIEEVAPADDMRTEEVKEVESKRAPRKNTTRDRDLRKTAQRALRTRDYALAAESYEKLLARLPENHGERASIRLELARLYMRYLGKREMAIDHLREFVGQHPLDVAAPSARRQLCQLLGMRAAKDPACISIQMDQ